MSIQLCTTKDIYFEWLAYIRREAHFSALLSNGEVIYQDDYRAECEHNKEPIPVPDKAWDRLRSYISQNNLWIKNIRLQNLDNVVEPLPDDAHGFFFKKGAIGALFSQQLSHFYIIGYVDLKTKTVKTFKYGVPELLLLETEERPLKKDDSCVILRPGLNPSN
jgi:hypothetical protein